MTDARSDYKTHAKRLLEALAADGIAVPHGKALELVARMNGARDWNTLAAQAEPTNPGTSGAPFSVGQRVEGTFNGTPAQGRVIGMAETICRAMARDRGLRSAGGRGDVEAVLLGAAAHRDGDRGGRQVASAHRNRDRRHGTPCGVTIHAGWRGAALKPPFAFGRGLY